MATAVWTDDGQAYAVDLLDPTTRAAAGQPGYHLAWGSNNAALDATDDSLTEHPESRVAATVGQADTDGNAADDRLRLTAQIEATGSRSVAEAGFYTLASGGLLFIRALFPTVPIESGDRLELDVSLRLRSALEA